MIMFSAKRLGKYFSTQLNLSEVKKEVETISEILMGYVLSSNIAIQNLPLWKFEQPSS